MTQQEQHSVFTLNPPTEEVLQKLPLAKFVVEATAFERDTLYLQYRQAVSWQDGMPTRFLTLGQAYGRDICVKVSMPIIHDVGVLFVEPASELFDHKLLAAWLDKYCNPLYDRNRRKARTEAREFRDCLRALRELSDSPEILVPWSACS